MDVLRLSITQAEHILKTGGSALDAVEMAVKIMEDSPLFNAGKGSVFNSEARQEMDASIMDGEELRAGSVAGVTKLKNPIAAARKVMEKSEHVMLIGEGAEKFAIHEKCETEQPSYFYVYERYQQLQLAKKNDEVLLDHTGENKTSGANMEDGNRKLGTVGAVAMDKKGNLAAATSTGGMTNKKFGRIGDTPIIGAGTYANNQTCAVSCTGHGEFFIRNVVGYDLSALIEYKELSLAEAANQIIHKKLGKQNIEGGLIAIDAQGNFISSFNTPGMYRACVTSLTDAKIEIYK